jgi:tetratricopeptide (TPR) repeat protein
MKQRLDRSAAAVFATALLIRLIHVWQLRRSPFFDVLIGDAHGYDEWARRIAGGDWIGREVFYQAPLYPYFLGAIFATFGHSLVAVRIIQAIIGSASCALLVLAGRRFFSPRAGQIAGFALAIYAPAIFFDALVQKSVLDLFFISLALWLLSRLVDRPASRADWLSLGLTMGALSLTRENALVFTIVILAWCLLLPALRTTPARASTADTRSHGDGRSRRAHAPGDRATLHAAEGRSSQSRTVAARRAPAAFRRTGAAAAFLLGLAIILLPVAMRNYMVGGGFYLTTSQFGPNFYIGNSPRADGTYMSLRFGRGAPEYERVDATELAEHALGRSLTPAEVSGYWTGQATAFITGEPAAWLKLLGRKILLLSNATEMLDTESQESHAEWSWPLKMAGPLGHFGVLVPLALLGAIVAWPQRKRLAILYAMTIAYASSVVMFYVFARYRLPLVPMLMLFASIALVTVPGWLHHRGGHPADALDPREPPDRSRPSMSPLSASVIGAAAWQRSAVVTAVVLAAAFANWPMLSKPLMRAITESNLATALHAQGRTDEAIAHYRRAIELQPDYAPAYNNLGVVLRAKGSVDEAIESYRQALSLKVDYPDAHYNLANALLERNRPDEAAAHFRIALQSIPDSAGALNNLGVALAGEGKQEDAIAAFEAAVEAEPGSAVAHRNLGDSLANAGRVDAALAELQRAVALDPTDARSHYNLGAVLLEAGRLDEAATAFRATLQLSPRSSEAHNNLGITLGSQGQLDAAIDHFQQALKIDPNFADSQRNLALALEARANLRGAPR